MQKTGAQIQERAKELLALELSRLDQMMQALWPKARRGHLGAIDRVLRVMERRSRYLGLDAPTKLEGDFITHDEDIDEELRQLVHELSGGTPVGAERGD